FLLRAQAALRTCIPVFVFLCCHVRELAARMAKQIGFDNHGQNPFVDDRGHCRKRRYAGLSEPAGCQYGPDLGPCCGVGPFWTGYVVGGGRFDRSHPKIIAIRTLEIK
ncbi:MAG TPA: hypothetical protein DEB70_11160, partial [Planctomycetaceae bacterium]|nr:hypothetical protein [Planctomycetaceae bacterium]